MIERQIRVVERYALMGPNLWSNGPCIQWKIDIGAMEERPSNTIPGFVERLKEVVPSLIEHRCSEGVRGGFFSRLDDGTWMGHIMEHIAIEIQNLAGATVGFGRARSADEQGVYHVVYECEERDTGIEAGLVALELIEHLIAGVEFPFDSERERVRQIREDRLLGPSTSAIVEAALKRGIPYIRLNEQSLVQLGFGAFAKRIQATTTSGTSFHGVEIAGDKDLTKSLLSFHGIPVPAGETCQTVEGAIEIANRLGWPVVVKPLDASHGRGIFTDIRSEEDLIKAFEDAKTHRTTIIVERYLAGSDFRLLVINHKLIAAAQRVPARVTGDGVHTIVELVAVENSDPRRGQGHEKILTKIKLDEMTEHLLAMHGMTVSSIPAVGEHVYLKSTANLSTGGFAIDVTDKVHPSNLHLAQRISRLVNLDIIGIDVIASRIDVPIGEVGGGIIEVNAAPGFRMHVAPTEGKPRAVGEAVIDMLFPPGTESRIPILTVTGTNGKTTTARLCAHIAKQSGHTVGLTTTDGIYINNERIVTGDCSGPQSAKVVLREPSTTFAVLETARGGMLRSGLAYDWSDAAIVTNVAADHLGLRDIHTVEDLAEVKAIPVERVRADGYAILNAEDAMTERILEHANCKIAYFALDQHNVRFHEHVANGGVGVTVEDETIVLWENGVRVPITELRQVPLTFDGRAQFNTANTMAAVAACYACDIEVEDIRIGIQTFFPSMSQTPGRLNFFEVRDFNVVIDYAHNPHGFAAVSDFVTKLRKNRLVAIVGVPGDRRDEDIAEAGRIAARSFDLVVLREDFQTRGRERGEVASLLRKSMVEAGFPESNIHVVPEEPAAVKLALSIAQKDDLVVYFADVVEKATMFIEEFRHGGDVIDPDDEEPGKA